MKHVLPRIRNNRLKPPNEGRGGEKKKAASSNINAALTNSRVSRYMHKPLRVYTGPHYIRLLPLYIYIYYKRTARRSVYVSRRLFKPRGAYRPVLCVCVCACVCKRVAKTELIKRPIQPIDRRPPYFFFVFFVGAFFCNARADAWCISIAPTGVQRLASSQARL